MSIFFIFLSFSNDLDFFWTAVDSDIDGLDRVSRSLRPKPLFIFIQTFHPQNQALGIQDLYLVPMKDLFAPGGCRPYSLL